MYGVRNHSVNFPAGYNNYGKNNPAQNPTETHNTAEEKYAGRTDQILFSAVKRKEDDVLSGLSDEAKSYLATLQEKYPDYSFTIADYKTDEEASRLLSRGTGEINVLITPDLLEKMATDEAVRAKYEGVIDGAKDQFAEIKEKLSDGGKSIIKRLGFTVNEDGTTSFYAMLKRGITGEDGSRTVKSSLVSEFTDMLNAIAESRQKMLETNKDDPDKPVDKEEQKEKSVMPPKSFEKYRKEPEPYSTEEDYGDLPPESFEKYRKQEDPYSIEEDYGSLPPESFKKYQEEANADTKAKSAGEEMNFSV